MSKKNEKSKPMCVEYKGGELILERGKKVYQIEIATGLVSEYKPKLILTTIFSKKKKYIIQDREGFECIPAYNIDEAKGRFRRLTRPLGIKVAIK